MSSAFADTHNMVAILNKSDASEVKQSTDVTRLQALVNRKKVMISEAVIRDILQLDDAEGVNCLPNDDIFTGLARIGSAMASAVICLSTGRKFNFSKYIFDSLVRNVDSSSKFYMYPRVGKGFLGVETPLFEGMLVVQENVVEGIADEQVPDDTAIAVVQEVVTTTVLEDVHDESIPSPAPPTRPPQLSQDIPSTSQAQSPPQQLQSSTPAQSQFADFPISLLQTALDACAALTLRVEHLECDKESQTLDITKLKTRVKKLERVNKVKALKLRRLKKVGTSQRVETSDDTIMEDVSNQGRMIVELDRDKSVELMNEKEKIKEVVTTAKRIAEVVNAASTLVSTASIIIPTAEPNIPAVIVTAAPVKVAAASTRRRRGVVIRDPEEESTTVTPAETKDKGKDWTTFEAKFNSNMEFLLKSKEKIEEEANRALESINETPAQKAAKRRRLNEQAKEVEDLKQHLEIVLDEVDDVYTEATPLDKKVPVMDYQIIQVNNKPRYKIIKADGTHQQRCLEDQMDKIIYGRVKELILLVERRYPLSKFTLEQMLNVVRLQVEEQSEMSLELLRFTRQQLQEGQQE
uniref:Synaptobrevin, longin-like domain protein n=1 Tax=Tanacetum cinerariifolium TaxID=118510 RepID=A0A699JK14_TANCI|nr:synaptobrevin, longin-like domain protein [Tanacetum cinerariifolium]